MNPAATMPAGATVLTVSQITSHIKNSLEGEFPGVWVVGELSKVTLHRSGHLYIDLKDSGAVIKVVMWRTAVQKLSALPQAGTEVFVYGRVTVYAPQGNYQLNIDQIHPKGLGAQDLALRRLKERLAKLGYFAPERKRPLPRFPRRIALLASPTGAAIRDILEVLRSRWPLAEVWVIGVRVQGPGAPESVATGFALLDAFSDVDAVILGRGGGSTDDLSAFNDERVAHAIFRCRFPVVSAIGHEIDVTIADQVADQRALTPTDAANQVVPDRKKLIEELRLRGLRLHDLLQSRLQAVKNRLLDLAQRRVFCLPLERVHDRERALDEWSDRLVRAMQKRVQLARKGVEVAAAKLESLSPLNVLARGYSLTRTLPEQQVVRGIDQVQPGDTIEILLHDGRLTARVEGRVPKDGSLIN
jgi:exodeoxyribonuclease VII large subunit